MVATETETASADPLVASGLDRLLVVHAPDPADVGQSKVLDGGSLVIGREEDSEPCLLVRQPRVSRRHARVEPNGTGDYRIVDLKSRNGTFVNGQRIDEATLCSGDIIRVGRTLLLMQHLDARAVERMLEPRRDSGQLVGRGHAIAGVRADIEAAPAGTPILVLGETGVGKELVARALHERSGRSGPLVPVNCSALPDNLVESELFGHARGAFTGAEGRAGLFVRAERGTLFLDEIGEVPVAVQAKLLRVLEVREIRPVGSDRERTIEVGVVAATNVDLEQAIEAGSFRADLYARLMAHVIRVPPLRDRKEDVCELAAHFLAPHKGGLTADAAEALLVHGWPYNVRELAQTMTPLRELPASHGPIQLADLPERLHGVVIERAESLLPPPPIRSELVGIARDSKPGARDLLTVFEAHEGSVAAVAAFFGRDRKQIYRWAKSLEIDLPSLRERFKSED